MRRPLTGFAGKNWQKMEKGSETKMHPSYSYSIHTHSFKLKSKCEIVFFCYETLPFFKESLMRKITIFYTLALYVAFWISNRAMCHSGVDE